MAVSAYFSQTLRSHSLKLLYSQRLTQLKRVKKKQHTVETLILPDFYQIRIVASKNYFVRNAGKVHQAR